MAWSRIFLSRHFLIDERVEIGSGSKVWHFCHISEGAKIGSGTNIGQGAFIGRGVIIGNNGKCRIMFLYLKELRLKTEFFVALGSFHKCDQSKSLYRTEG